jgi:hypothetical protein
MVRFDFLQAKIVPLSVQPGSDAHLPIQWVLVISQRGRIKLPRGEAYHLPLSGEEVKKGGAIPSLSFVLLWQSA